MSNTKPFKTRVREQLQRAWEDGVTHPVVAYLWQDSPHAQAIHRQRHGRSIKTTKGDGGIILETWSREEAPRLLRRHAGIGGSAIANLVDSVGDLMSWWYMEFQPPSLTVKGFETAFPVEGWGRATFDNLVLYDELLDTICRRCKKKLKGRGATHCHLRDGRKTVVCGASTKEMTATIKLITVADTGCLQSLCFGKMTAPLDLKDEDLALILRRLYSDRPQVVAEAVRALRKVSRKRADWLTRVLDGTPSLSTLAAAVRWEIG